MTKKERVVARACGCLGARFRAQGRSPAFGLDCVGVAAIAYDCAVPSDYALRGGDPDVAAAMIEAAGLHAIACDDMTAGDLALIAVGDRQLHLAVLASRGFIHADARLRRVVETPGLPSGTILGAWEVRS